MNISSISNINFLQKKILSTVPSTNPIKFLACDTFQKTAPIKYPNATYANQKKLDANNFDSSSTMNILNSYLDIDKVIDISKTISNPRTNKIEFNKSNYSTGEEYVMKASDREGSKSLLLDKDLKIQAQEESYLRRLPEEKTVGAVSGFVLKNVKTKDFRTNTESEVEYLASKKDNRFIPVKEVKIKRDAQNRLIRTEIAEMSNVSGVYNVKYDFPNGKSRVLSTAKVDAKTGNTLIVKDMRSADMTRTQYRYEDDPQGNRLVEYKITSSEGNVLMKQSQTFEKINDNKFVSSRNGKIYDIEMDDDKINIKSRSSNEQKQIDLGTIFGQKEKVIKALKTIPGDELMQLADKVETFEGISESLLSSCSTSPDMWGEINRTKSRLNVSDNTFIFLHELGHAIDSGNREFKSKDGKPITSDFEIIDALCDDKDFVKTYNEEKENFTKEFPEVQREFIDYFISNEAVEGEKERGRQETIAESNGILNSYDSVPELGMRSQYLQQHFPKTIAYLSNKLTQV